MDLFNAFKIVPNLDFIAHTHDERKAWELGVDKDADIIISETLAIYNNAIASNRWQTMDPKIKNPGAYNSNQKTYGNAESVFLFR